MPSAANVTAYKRKPHWYDIQNPMVIQESREYIRFRRWTRTSRHKQFLPVEILRVLNYIKNPLQANDGSLLPFDILLNYCMLYIFLPKNNTTSPDEIDKFVRNCTLVPLHMASKSYKNQKSIIAMMAINATLFISANFCSIPAVCSAHHICKTTLSAYML